MMRAILALLAALLFCAPAVADVVYLRGGKTYEGKVTRRGDKILVEMELGTVELDADDVLAIDELPDEPEDPEDADGEKESPNDADDALSSSIPIAMAHATRPEPIIFALMSVLEGTEAGAASYDVRRQIERWQTFAHDRKRRAGARWLDPEDFVRRRNAYAEHHREGEQLASKAARIRGDDPAERLQRAKWRQQAAVHFRKAAGAWADPLLRTFLLGAAELRGDVPAKASALFERCASEQPRIAVFHQGRGFALQRADRHLEAVEAFTRVLELQPGSSDAVDLLRDALQKVPGAEIRSTAFRLAEDLLSTYEESSRRAYTRRGEVWLMPGDELRVDEDELPTPPMDRFTFLQGVGVPIGNHTLLVDAAVVEDAAAIHVSLGDTWVVGYPRRISTYGRAGDTPLAMVHMEGVELTPLTAEEETTFAADEAVTAYALPLYAEMGSTIRPLSGGIERVGETGPTKVSVELSPGDAAGPIVTEDGRIAGFLAGRTDPRAADGGESRLIPYADVYEFVRRARRSSRVRYGYRRVERQVEPTEYAGRHFLVTAVHGERFEDE